MRLYIPVILAVAVVCALAVFHAPAAPKPSEVAVDWELDFKFKPLQAVELKVPGESAPRVFWFLCYTVTNRTGGEQVFIPEFSLYTRTGQLTSAGQNVPEYVTNAIRTMLNNPLLKNPAAMSGKILQGEDNAEDGVAIWPDYDPQAGTIDIFIGGLSGETQEVALPTPVTVMRPDANGNPAPVVKKSVVLTKTLQLTYNIPGDAASRSHAPIHLVEKQWVMR